jgi:hypothetical protein
MSVPFNPLIESRAVPSLNEYLWRRYWFVNDRDGTTVGCGDGAAVVGL